MQPYPLIAITQGDPAGIGPEIIAQFFRDAPSESQGCFVVGSVEVMRRAARCIGESGVQIPVAHFESSEMVRAAPPRCIPVCTPSSQSLRKDLALPTLGKVSAEAGQMAADCVIWAADAALKKQVQAVVTAPLHKEALALAGYKFPGHTELLQARAAHFLGLPTAQVPVKMMLANSALRTVLVSIHISLRAAIEAVTFENVLQTLQITHQSLFTILGRKPRIGVAGLNPHAGESGILGREEIDIIAPAIAAAQQQGIDASGPWAPDTIFMRARQATDKLGEFDVVIAMYHDQGLIPVKYLGLDEGVNCTLGLPFIRTSPDHGTAFDIAGQGIANPASLIQAVRMARQLINETKK